MNTIATAPQPASAEPSRPGGSSVLPLVVFAAVLLLSLGFVIARSRAEARELAQLEKQTDAEATRSKRLAAVKAKVDRAERAKEAFRTRAEVIQALLSNQASPARPLEVLGQAVQRAADVRIATVEWEPGRLGVRGQAALPAAIDNFKSELERAGGYTCSPAAAAGAGQASAASFDFECAARPAKGAAAPKDDHAK